MEELRHFNVNEMVPSPLNARKEMGDINGLKKSICHNGLIQPIVVRQKDGAYEIIAGERRHAAIRMAIEEGLLPENYEIKTIVTDVEDDQVVQRMMLVENLEREGLSDYEQVAAFHKYIGECGEEEKKAISFLSEKTGIKPEYIRRRVRVMSLPEEILNFWKEGTLTFSHLEQLLRVPSEEALNLATKVIEMGWSLSSIKRTVDSSQSILNRAVFNKKEAGCTKCQYSTQVQRSLFGGDDMKVEGNRCLNPLCFAEKTKEHILANWPESENKETYKTNTAIITDDAWSLSSFHYGEILENCYTCDKFATAYNPSGEVARNQCCLDKECFAEKYMKPLGIKPSSSNSGEKTPEEKAEQRSAKIGQEFTDRFFQQKMAEYSDQKPNNVIIMRMALIAMIKGNANAFYKVMEKESQDPVASYGITDAFCNKVIDMDVDELQTWTIKLSREVVMNPIICHTDLRDALCRQYDIVLERDFIMDEDYLKRKTKTELIALNEQFKVFDMSQGVMEKMKKTDLVATFLAHDLSGLIPDDITDVTKELQKGREQE